LVNWPGSRTFALRKPIGARRIVKEFAVIQAATTWRALRRNERAGAIVTAKVLVHASRSAEERSTTWHLALV
jgi:hypothetical protein